MKTLLTRSFPFSASYAQGTKIIGHNYELEVTVDALDEPTERLFEKKVHESLIQRIQSRDLGADAGLLRGVDISDASLLKAFWKLLEPALSPIPLKRLALRRGGGHLTSLEP